MMQQHIAFIVTVLTVILICKSQHSEKYDVMLTELGRCSDIGTGDINFSSVRLSRDDRYTTSFFNTYTLKIPFDDSLSVVSETSAWSNGGWRPGFFTLDIPQICKGMKQFIPSWFHELLKNTGHDDCPIPPGNYSISARNMSVANFNIPILPCCNGKYKVIHQIFKGDVKVGCFTMVAQVIPKRMKLPKKKH